MQSSRPEILRELAPNEAFHFYINVDRPLHVSASSFPDFLVKFKTVPVESIEFHTSRGDFEKWIQMLGGETLARRIRDLMEENLRGEALRRREIQILESDGENVKPPTIPATTTTATTSGGTSSRPSGSPPTGKNATSDKMTRRRKANS